MSLESIGRRMQDAEAFDGVVFLGTAKNAKRDPYRLSLFGTHLESDERPLVILPVQGGTLLVTDRRLLELRAHLEILQALAAADPTNKQIPFTIRKIERPCVRCGDTGFCPHCKGRGQRRFLRMDRKCEQCYGRGICPACGVL